jgi:hypothetical protein
VTPLEPLGAGHLAVPAVTFLVLAALVAGGIDAVVG